MEKIKNFIKNKGLGYFFVAGLALASLIFAIIFLCTFNGEYLDVEGTLAPTMGNRAADFGPVTIGIFMLAGFVVEVVVLFVPQYKFIQIIAIAMFGLALYKDVLIIPDFFAGVANGVHYNHGNFGLNFFYFGMLLAISVVAIVAAFLPFYKEENDPEDRFAIPEGGIVKVAVCGALVAAAVVGSTVSSSLLTKGKAQANKGDSTSSQISVEPAADPITDEIRALAEAYDYDFDPTSVIIRDQNENYYVDGKWNFNDPVLSNLTVTSKRPDNHIVYYFEGSYSEGWQGDYSPYYAEIYLWDDGTFAGKSNSDNFKGFWYNCSLNNPEDTADTLIMVSNSGNFSTINTDPKTGFYQREAYIYLNPGWGGRSVPVAGYYYYPEVALFIDSGKSALEYKVGDYFNRGSWTAKRVLKNLSYSAVFKGDTVKWTDEAGMLDSNNCFVAAGEYTVTATWNGFTATKTITVTE